MQNQPDVGPAERTHQLAMMELPFRLGRQKECDLHLNGLQKLQRHR